MSFKQFSALMILKGRFGFRPKKCLFSDTSASAPVHSTYAAIKASAGLNPINSYFEPNSKGTTKSSSIVVNELIKLMNSPKASCDKLRLTSSTIVRVIRTVCACPVSSSFIKNAYETGFFDGPKAKIYSFESMTNCNFFFPDFLSRFTQFLNNLFLAQLINRRRIFSDHLSELFKMFFCALGIGSFCLHNLLPLSRFDSLISKFNHTGGFLSNAKEYAESIQAGGL